MSIASARYAGIHMQHPSGAERIEGATSHAELHIDRGLKSRKLDAAPLSRHDLVKLCAEATRALAILDGVRTSP